MGVLELARRFLAVGVVAACVAAAWPIGCGGCYNDYVVTNLRTEPATPCLVLSAGEVDPCTGSYDIGLRNDCAGTLDIAGQSVAPGSSVILVGAEASSSADGVHGYSGMLDGQPLTVAWNLADPTP